MNTSRKKTIDEIFSRALDRTGDERQRYIIERCHGDTSLHSEITALLEAAERPDNGLVDKINTARDHLWRSVLTADERAEEDLCGQRVGAWRIMSRIARGGLATVYMAKRDDGQFEQVVAFKVLRRGLDTDDLVARFRAERQILSSLEHPAIARILDGGALDDGRPFLVLEYIDGVPITDYCEQHSIGVTGRIRMLIEVLRALHHAHNHLVIHRDIKPSNILVSAEGHVALLDFGIAKLIDPDAIPGASTLTRTGVSVLTPGYGSPEQIAGRAVTTASDIYQAGTLLFELLTGQRATVSLPQQVSGEPVLPSELLRGKPDYRRVRGDLDAIVRKATHADPGQRYASANEMVVDLQRYLDEKPVLAQPDSVRYRLGKLGKRRPWLIPCVLSIVLGITAYEVTLTMYSNRLEIEERRALAAQSFLVDVLSSPDPFAPADAEKGRNITVVEALAIGQKRIRSELGNQPELQASLLVSVSDVYASLDQVQEAIDLREDALAIERRLYGELSRPVLLSLRALGKHYSAINDWAMADKYIDAQLQTARMLYADNDPEQGVAEIAQASYLVSKGNRGESREILLQGIDKLRAAPEQYAQHLIDALVLFDDGYGMRPEEPTFEAIAEAERVAVSAFGPQSLQAAIVRIRLASTMTNYGNFEGSERNFLAAIPVLESQLGPDHSSTLSALNNLGYLYHRRNDKAAAERIHRDLLARQISKQGLVHESVGDSYQNLAGAITHQGRFEESIPLHRKAYEIFGSVMNADNYKIALPLLSIAYAELQLANAMAAEEAAREALGRLESTAPGTVLEGVAMCLVGLALEQQGQVSEGSDLVLRSHPLLGTSRAPEPYPKLCRLAD